MTATNTKMAEMESKIAQMSAGMETITKALTVLLERESKPAAQPVAVVAPQSTVTMVAEPTEAQLREFMRANGMESRGKFSAERKAAVLAKYRAAHGQAVARVETRAAVKSSSTRWGDFAPRQRSAESQFGRPTRKQAEEEYPSHPERPTVESLSADELFAFSQAGKPNAVMTEFRTVPLSSNHRRCIAKLALSRSGQAGGADTAGVKLVVAEAVAIAKDVGIKF